MLALLLLLALLISMATGQAGAKTASILLFSLVGLGFAPLQLQGGRRWSAYAAMGIGLGIGIVLLTGLVLVELPVWRAGPAVFWALAAGATILHVQALREEGSALVALVAATWHDARRASSTAFLVGTLSVAGAALTLGTAASQRHLVPHHLGGYVTAAKPTWWLGVILMTGAVLLALRRAPRLLPLSAVVLAVAVVGTPSVLYDLARYDWTQKHIGVTQYFLLHGAVNTSINDIYQSWPGFFAAIAWLCHVAGVRDIEAIARWWQPAIALMAMFAARSMAGSLGFDRRRSWLAALLTVLGTTVAQDYFSPQSIAYVGALVIYGVALRRKERPRGASVLEWLTVFAVSGGLAFTHQLTPFVVSGLLLILVVFDRIKSRLMPLVTVLPAGIWAAVNHGQVTKYLNVQDIGQVASNVATPNAALGYHYTHWVYVSDAGQVLAPGIIVVLAAITLFRWRDRQPRQVSWRRPRSWGWPPSWGLAFALTACAGAQIALFLFHYGQESLLRATLFAVPWVALLASMGRWNATRLRRLTLLGSICAITLAYVAADMALDNVYVVRPTDLSALQYFEHDATYRSTVVSISDAAYVPWKSTDDYGGLLYRSYDLPQAIDSAKGKSTQDKVATVAQAFTSSMLLLRNRGYYRLHPGSFIFAVTTQQAAAQWATDGALKHSEYLAFQHQLLTSTEWSVVDQTKTATLFEFVVPPTPLRVRKNHSAPVIPPGAAPVLPSSTTTTTPTTTTTTPSK
ncbi:MAG: hypothetical protein ACYC0E_01770 [Acidimicrobiales bacterium]